MEPEPTPRPSVGRRPSWGPLRLAQLGFAGIALARLSRGRVRRPPLTAPSEPVPQDISVVIPARDEETRLPHALAPLAGAPGVREVIVVDDGSQDATVAVAASHGATVVSGGPLPDGWVGKPWALQQGLVAASGEVVVFLDADVRPDPALPAALAAVLRGAGGRRQGGASRGGAAAGERSAGAQERRRAVDLASAQLAFRCPGLAQRLLHPALLTTLVLRLGPLDTVSHVPAGSAAINGQAFAVRREALLATGGFGIIAGIPTDDVALARALARSGWRIGVADGSALGEVRMYESAAEAIREWAGRSLALPGAAPRARQLADLALVAAVQARPALALWGAALRLVRDRRGVAAALRGAHPTDLALLGLRLSLQVALGRVYRVGLGPGSFRREVPDPVALLAPLADPVAVAALARGTLRPVTRWRGRELRPPG